MNDLTQPLAGLVVVDFSQFLAGPACSLRLADLGAEVIKIEKPSTGDICRQLYVAKQKIGNESTIFHAINRNKKSVALDLKTEKGYRDAIALIKRADVVIQNFRPGVAKKLKIDYDTLKSINARIIYGSVSGYGSDSATWHEKPGQDLLAQSMSGIVWSNIESEVPTPMGLSIADLSAAYDLTQGILALLVRRGVSGTGGMVEVSLIESLFSLQSGPMFEHLNRAVASKNTLSDAKGIYECYDGHIAIGCVDTSYLNTVLSSASDSSVKSIKEFFSSRSQEDCLKILEQANIPCSGVFNWTELRKTEHYRLLNFEQGVCSQNNIVLKTTRCPITIDGAIFTSPVGAPSVGEQNHLFL